MFFRHHFGHHSLHLSGKLLMNNTLKNQKMEQTAPDRNSASSLQTPRNTLKTKGFT